MTEKSVASSKSGSKQNYMLQEKTGFEKLSAEIKDSVFQVLYLILKEEDDSLLSFFFNVSADYLQMAAFAFNSNVNSVWKATSFMNFIFNFFNWFQLQTYFSAAFTFTSYLVSFYLTVAVIVLMFTNIIYVSWAFSKKRVSAIWPVMVLRSVTSLLCTVFFLPTTELLLTMVECSYDGNGVYVNSNYTNIRCFVDAHIIHSVVAIIVIFLFSILGFVVALAYFEIRMLTEDPTARQHSRGDVLFIANKVVLQLSFSFFSSSMQWWLVLILAGGALILWYSYNIDEPYYRKEPTLFFKIITNYYLWTCLLVLVSKVLENTTFDGGLVTWLVGMPFIGVILVSSTKSRITSLVQSASRFKTSNDLMDHIRFVLQLVDLYSTDKSARILLTGYVEKHKDTCEEDDCPLKLKRKKRMSLGSEADEMSLGLILVADRMYQAGLKKFKNSAKLRIFYAIFLLERMKKMKKAEQELAKAKECNPGFEDQFVIFRLSKMIADGMEGVDVVGLIAWDNYKNLYQEFVRESANLHKEFWSELHEDSPNLHKLNYLGSRVNNAMSLAREYWNKVQRVRTDDPVILKTYGRFLIDIQNDVVEGYDLIEKAKKQVSQRISHNFAKRNSFDAGLDSLPYVEVVGSGQEMGKIKQANLLFTVLVGVNRDEILEKKVNLFMPDFFSQYHDSFLKRFNNREEDYDIGYLDKDNNLFVRSRSGYIIPVTLRVSRLKTEEATNQIVFGAWFKTETAKRTYVHLICAKDGTISDISASAVTVLNLSLQNVKKTRMNIDKIVPHALTDKGYREGGKEINYKLNDTTTLTFIAQITPITIKDERNLDFFEAYSSQNPGKPLTAADMAYGFIIKLDKLDKAGETTVMAQMDMSKLSSAKKRKKETIMSAGFERENSMRSDPSRASKVENLGDNTKVENDGQIIFGFNTEYAELEISELFQNDGGVKLDIDALVKQEEHVERVQINYGEGINLKKFMQGRLYDIRNDTDEAPPPVEDDDEGSLFLRRDDDDFDTGLNKKRKDKLSALKRLVRDALEASQKNSTVSTIRWITFFWLACLYTIGILQYTLLSGLFGNYQNEIHVIQSFTQKLTEVDNINSYLTDFITFSTDSQVLTNYTEANYDTRAQEMQDCVNQIVSLTKELEEGSYYSIIAPLIENTVEIIVYGAEENETFTLNQTEAIFFISSRAYNLLTLMEGPVSTSNPEVMTVLSNYYNSILPALRSSTSALQKDLKNKLNSFEAEFLVLFILNGMIALVLSVWGMGVLIRIDQQKEDVLFLFLEIPLNNVDGISRKRDKFIEFFDITIRQLQTNNENGAPANDDGTDSDSLDEKRNMTANGNGNGKENVFDDSLKDGTLRSRDPDNREEVEDALKDRKKLIKKFKANQFAKAKSGLLKVLMLTVFSLVYSISSTVSIVVNKNELSNYSDQFFTTNLLSDNILTALNLNRLMRLDPDFQILNQNTVLASYDSLIELNSLGNDLGEFFLYVIRTNNKLEYEVTSLFFGDACEFITSDQAGCEESLSRALKLGVFNLKEQVLKILMEEYSAFINTNATTTDEYITLMSLNDEFKTYTFNILQQFNINEEDYLKGILDSAASLQEILLIIYLVIITILIVIFWLPYLSKLNAEVWRTTRMINMIPLDVVNNTLNIKRYLKGLIRG